VCVCVRVCVDEFYGFVCGFMGFMGLMGEKICVRGCEVCFSYMSVFVCMCILLCVCVCVVCCVCVCVLCVCVCVCVGTITKRTC